MGYSPDIYAAAEKTLELRRLKSEQDLEKRRGILFAAQPRAEQIERAIAKTSVLAAKAVFGGDDINLRLTELKEKNLALQNELNAVLKAAGYPENYLEPKFYCSKCRDRGDVDGKMCSCMKQLLRETAYERLNRISPLALSDFDSFSLDYYSKNAPQEGKPSPYTKMNGVLGYCKKYAKSFSTDSPSLLFQGAPGLGKTHLSLAIAKEAIDKGYGVIYVSAPAILSRIESEHFDIRKSDKDTERLVTECDLLILDDLGTEFVSKFTVSSLYNIINTRMICGRPTIISTNLGLADLEEKYNARTISRIIGSLERVEFVGSDIRQLKRRNRKKPVQE